MSTYGAMKVRLAHELRGRDDLLARIPASIASAIRHYENERFWFLEGESTTPTIAGQAPYASPMDMIEPDLLTLTDNGIRDPLDRRSWSWMRYYNDQSATTGIPEAWAYYADQLWLFPTPDGVYTLTLSYMKRLDALNADTDTNAWMTHGEELIRTWAKLDLLTQSGREAPPLWLIQALDRAEKDILRKSAQKISTGRLVVDAALAGQGRFNINKGY